VNEPDFPFLLYVYDADGRYSKPDRIETTDALEAAMCGPVKLAIAEKREVVITDVGDDCLFHAKDGRIIFPTPEDITRGAL
jgi:hypothetical protein